MRFEVLTAVRRYVACYIVIDVSELHAGTIFMAEQMEASRFSETSVTVFWPEDFSSNLCTFYWVYLILYYSHFLLSIWIYLNLHLLYEATFLK